MPLFSVLVPTYNRRDRLGRAIQSALAQRFPDYEIIVVDDGSTDGTIESLARFGERVRVIRQENGGPARARNVGARAATGEYIAFLDSDDWWMPWTLELYAELISRHGRPSWLYGKGYLDAAEASSTVPGEPLIATRFGSYYEAVDGTGLGVNPTGVIVRRDLFLRTGGFAEDLRVGEDFDLWFRIGADKGFVVMESPVAYVREHHPSSLTEDLDLAFRGVLELARRDREGAYPQGERPSAVRRGMISQHLVFYAGKFSRRRRRYLALRFYLAVLRLQAGNRFREPGFGGSRNRFLVSFPLWLAWPWAYGALRAAFRPSRPPQG